ncbi:MAG: CCA tRNA nucleotidyltransferase [Gemmatimonadales bacterium]|nr:MAG: CCA tRNA nucleotidyltransferase [Gemmatimonadales bacterium]
MNLPGRLQIPSDVLRIAESLEGAGFEAWCVGGAIRDTLLGELNTDYDIATSARPEEIQQLFRNTVPVGARFGTIAVRVHRRFHEVTTFRRDVATDGRHAVVEFGASLEEDLARRDFTVNAIAYHPLRHEWRDPWHGTTDLDARLIRAVGDPAQRFQEDYLRILRGLRFSARFRFAIEPATWAAMQAAADGLPRLSAERVRDEWFKGLRSAYSIRHLTELWLTSGSARVWIPELLASPEGSDGSAAMQDQAAGRHVGGLTSRRGVLPVLEVDRGDDDLRDPVLLTALLCIDPVSVLVRLKASNAEIARATGMVTGPEEPDSVAAMDVRRWMAAVDEAADDQARLWHLRHGAPPPWAAVMRGIRERGEPLTRKQLAVSGEDLREAGVAPGPAMGLLLDRLLALVVDDPELNTRDTLLERARSLV